MSEHDPYLGWRKDDGSTHSRLERANAALVRMGYAEDANRQLEVARAALVACEADAAAMRLALEGCVACEVTNVSSGHPPFPALCASHRAEAQIALSGTAGEHVAAVYRAAVAWRASETVTDAMGVNAAALIAAVDKAQGRTK